MIRLIQNSGTQNSGTQNSGIENRRVENKEEEGQFVQLLETNDRWIKNIDEELRLQRCAIPSRPDHVSTIDKPNGTLYIAHKLSAKRSAASERNASERNASGNNSYEPCANAPWLDVFIASSWLARLKGLFAYPQLQRHQALVIRPCSAVHTIGLKRTIDVVFLNRDGVVVKCCTLKPWSIAACKGAHSVVEMADGMSQQLTIRTGQRLILEEV